MTSKHYRYSEELVIMILLWPKNWFIKNQQEEKLIQLYPQLYFKSTIQVRLLTKLKILKILFFKLINSLTIKKHQNIQTINSSREISKDKRRRMKSSKSIINWFWIINKKGEFKTQVVYMYLVLTRQGTVFWLWKIVIKWMEA